MAGNLKHLLATIKTVDNYHRASTVTPVHHPHINTTCSGTEQCQIITTTITQNRYELKDYFDEGQNPVGAAEMKAKLLSR